MEVLIDTITVSHLDVTKLASVEPPGEDTVGRPVERVEPGGCHTKCLEHSWQVNARIKFFWEIIRYNTGSMG